MVKLGLNSGSMKRVKQSTFYTHNSIINMQLAFNCNKLFKDCKVKIKLLTVNIRDFLKKKWQVQMLIRTKYLHMQEITANA